MSGEKNVNVVGVEYLGEVLIHLIDLHFWTQRKSLHKEHGVLKSFHIRIQTCFPDYFYNLLESTWNEPTVWYDFDWNWSRCVDKESDWALLAWV